MCHTFFLIICVTIWFCIWIWLAFLILFRSLVLKSYNIVPLNIVFSIQLFKPDDLEENKMTDKKKTGKKKYIQLMFYSCHLTFHTKSGQGDATQRSGLNSSVLGWYVRRGDLRVWETLGIWTSPSLPRPKGGLKIPILLHLARGWRRRGVHSLQPCPESASTVKG